MPDFQPFTLADFSVGLYDVREPWLSPERSWRNLENFYVYRGRLLVRRGYELFGKLYHAFSQVLAGTSGQATVNGTAGNTPLRPGSFGLTDGVETFTDDGAGVLTGDQGGSGTINYTSGAYASTWNANTAANVTESYEWDPALPVMGGFDFFPQSGGEFLVAFNTRRIFRWDEAQDLWVDILGVDTWTGSENDYFWLTPFEDILVITNGIDAPRKYQPLSAPLVDLMATDFDPAQPGVNLIDTALLTIRHRGRLIYFNTIEAGTSFPQRARRTQINDPESFRDDLDFEDAPTNTAIVSAAVLGDEILVFNDGNESWRHRYTNDPQAPYDWMKLSGLRGSDATHSTVTEERKVLTLSGAALVETDGRIVADADDALPSVLETRIDPALVVRSYGALLNQLDQTWFTIVRNGQTLADRVLVRSFKNNSFALFAMPMSCFFFYRQASGAELWDDRDQNWDDYDDPQWDAFQLAPGFPLFLGGDHVGNVFKLNTGTSDNGATFRSKALSQKLSPYEGQADVHLGWLDIRCDRRDGVSLTIRISGGDNPTPYLVRSVDLTGEGGDEKVTVTVRVNQIAPFHQIEFEIDDAADWGIDYVTLNAAPTRKVRANAA